MKKKKIKKRKKTKIGKKLVFVISVKPYNQECIVICNGTFGEAIKLLKKQKGVNAKSTVEYIEKNKEKEDLKPNYKPDEGCAYLYTQLPKGYVMMLGHGELDWRSVVGLVVHESLHLAHYVLHRAGLTLSQDSEEAYTYLTENIVETILQKIY